MKCSLRTALALVLVASTARADVWQRAIEAGAPDPSLDTYERELSDGDEYTLQANARTVSIVTVRALVDRAAQSYRNAARARPQEAEPYFRLGALLNSFYFECQVDMPHPPTCIPGNHDPQRAKEIVEAWDAFEARAPLDPRVTSMLLERAILRTKMVATDPTNRKLLEGAARDYQAMIDRADSLNQRTMYLAYGNLAETYMMLGRLEDAIDTYKLAMRSPSPGNGTSTLYGYAVALDRDGQGAEAVRAIRTLRHDAFVAFQQDFQSNSVFYVPDGEEHYYFGLVSEAFGDTDAAIEHWRKFLSSGAHPQYQARAREHLDALVASRQLKSRPVPPPDPFGDFR